jgi:hypothetical protein
VWVDKCKIAILNIDSILILFILSLRNGKKNLFCKSKMGLYVKINCETAVQDPKINKTVVGGATLKL